MNLDLGIVANSAETKKFDNSNKYLIFGFNLAKNDYGISYLFRSGDSDYNSSSEIDDSIEESDNDEPVTDITTKNSNSQNEYSIHTIKLGWLKELKSGKKLDFVTSISLSLNNSESNYSFEQYQNYDPDEDGIFGQSTYNHENILEELSQRQSHIEAEYAALDLSAYTRILDDRNPKKTKSLSFGVELSTRISDDLNRSTLDSLSTSYYEALCAKLTLDTLLH